MELITGNKFKQICHYSYDNYYNLMTEVKDDEILKIFVPIDNIHNFFKDKPKRPYILITHNGDNSVDGGCLNYLDDPLLIKWYGQNIMTSHPKLQSIPIGIANEIWPHGDETTILNVINSRHLKENLIYVNFDVNTNQNERNYCLNELEKRGLKMGNKLPFKEYLEEVSKSYFVISPNGNGIDCHKTWESLYLKSVPIITKSINSEYYTDLPIIIIENWSEFDIYKLTVELYTKVWDNFNIGNLNRKYFLK